MIHFLPDWITGKICADLVNHCNSNSLTPAIRHRRFCPDRIEPAGGDPRCRVPVRPHNQTSPLWNWHTGSMTRRSETLDSGVPTGWIEIDPGDAKAPGIKDKKKICVAIRRGLVDAPARVTPYIMKGAHVHAVPLRRVCGKHTGEQRSRSRAGARSSCPMEIPPAPFSHAIRTGNDSAYSFRAATDLQIGVQAVIPGIIRPSRRARVK